MKFPPCGVIGTGRSRFRSSPYLAFLHVEIAAFHPPPLSWQGLVSVALIRPAPRRVLDGHEPNVVHGARIYVIQKVGVTHYDALRSSDFPPTAVGQAQSSSKKLTADWTSPANHF